MRLAILDSGTDFTIQGRIYYGDGLVYLDGGLLALDG